MIGFLIVIALSGLSVRPSEKPSDQGDDDDGDDDKGKGPSTPRRTPRVKKGTLGTIETPVGRRSARIARRKED